MKRTLCVGHHKIMILILVFVMAVLGVGLGIMTYGADYLAHNFDIIMLTLIFINTGLLLAIVAILLHIGENKE